MARFYLLRHCQAEDGPELQTDRPLTATGEAQLPVIADFLKTQTNDIGAVMCSSDLLRGQQTGEYLADKLDVPLIQTPYVDPPGADEDLDKVTRRCWNTIKAQMAKLEDGEELVVVSHGPTLNRLVAMLIDCGPGDKMHYAHGTVSHWDTEEPDPGNGWPIEGRGLGVKAIMHWMITPKCANRAMEGDRKAVIEEAIRIADSVLGSMSEVPDVIRRPVSASRRQRLQESGRLHFDEARGEYYYDTENVKRWVVGDGGNSGPCDVCEDNADMGWIPDDDVFDGVDGDVDGPPAHPNCVETGCVLEYKEKRVRVYV